jgi:hypothetical protein
MEDPAIEVFSLGLAMVSESLDVARAVATCRSLEKTMRDALNGNEPVGKDVLTNWTSRIDASCRLATRKVDLLVKCRDASRDNCAKIVAMSNGDQRRRASIGNTQKYCEEMCDAMIVLRAECVDIKTRTDALIESVMQSAK